MRKKTILVIDDEKELVEIVRYSLEANGYKVLAAYDGDEGLKLAKKGPDLILLDIKMPTISGIEVCRLIKEDPKLKNIPIIFLTGKKTKEDQVQGLLAGGDAYIVKPFKMYGLLAKIRELLKKKR